MDLSPAPFGGFAVQSLDSTGHHLGTLQVRGGNGFRRGFSMRCGHERPVRRVRLPFRVGCHVPFLARRPIAELTQEQKYMFDARGWLLIPNVLTEDEVNETRDFCLQLRHDPQSIPEKGLSGGIFTSMRTSASSNQEPRFG